MFVRLINIESDWSVFSQNLITGTQVLYLSTNIRTWASPYSGKQSYNKSYLQVLQHKLLLLFHFVGRSH